MKKIRLTWAIALAAVFCFAACHHGSKKESAKAETEKVDVLETTEVDVQLKPSDAYFADALNAFENKDNAAASASLALGVEAFRKETADLTGRDKTRADAAVKHLEEVNQKLLDGKLHHERPLYKAIARVQAFNAHLMLVSIDDYFFPERQTDVKTRFAEGMKKLRAIEAKDKTAATAEWREMVQKGDAIEKKLNSDAKVTEQEVKDFNASVHKWLEAESKAADAEDNK